MKIKRFSNINEEFDSIEIGQISELNREVLGFKSKIAAIINALDKIEERLDVLEGKRKNPL